MNNRPAAKDRLHLARIKELACGTRCRLTENKRSDPELFRFIVGLGVNTNMARDLQEALADARKRLPVTSAKPRYTITMSHRRRVVINTSRMNDEKPPDAVRLTLPAEVTTQSDSRNLPQALWVWPGMELVGYSGKVKRGLLYDVLAVSEEDVAVAIKGAEEGTHLSHKQAAVMLRPSYAMIFAACQGLTLAGRVWLECNNPCLTLTHLYVGASRATAADLLEVL
jgi:hypothetical protein